MFFSRVFRKSVFMCCLLILFTTLIGYSATPSPVVVVQIKGEIDGGQAALLHRAMLEAKRQQARAVIVEIDTFGGLVNSAVNIRDLMIESQVETICYIKNRAWSAGALIALSHKHIAIAPGGSIGAAEPIPTTEKTVAALKAEFAATANRTGRNPRVAEAMVDKSLGLTGYAEPGQILALTDYQAIQVGYADVVAEDRANLLKHYGLQDAPIIEFTPEWPEKLAGLLSNPTVQSALVSIIFLAIMTEIKTAGLSGAGFVAIAAAALLFGSQWLTGLAGFVEILLFAGGIILIIVELFVPGAGFFGIAGLIAILVSIFLVLGGDVQAFSNMSISLIAAVILFLFIAKHLPNSKFWSRFILKETETTQAGYVSANDYKTYLNKTGVAETYLRPAGTVLIEDARLDVVSEGIFIKPGTKVIVIAVQGNRIVVRPIE
ncbi:NfeD family protein [Dendrosporobacter sp. 1207_IL3150]|uniref:NfeD family protein n=1 Tax=Dendrosporobacter sp. 1207_IL3150 TaxID=3084054 RepID=UPI002FD99E23